jgi:hypothetical protein
MVGLKRTPIPKKGCGQVCVISCAPFAVSISVIYMSMLPFTSFASISNAFHPLSSLLSFTDTLSEHEPCVFVGATRRVAPTSAPRNSSLSSFVTDENWDTIISLKEIFMITLHALVIFASGALERGCLTRESGRYASVKP